MAARVEQQVSATRMISADNQARPFPRMAASAYVSARLPLRENAELDPFRVGKDRPGLVLDCPERTKYPRSTFDEPIDLQLASDVDIYVHASLADLWLRNRIEPDAGSITIRTDDD